MAQVALALQFCHKKQILHRDIKPSNVYLDKAGLLKLGDFGMARSLGESLAQTVVGTPYAMAPELCHSQPYSYKVRVPHILSYLHRGFFKSHSRALKHAHHNDSSRKRAHLFVSSVVVIFIFLLKMLSRTFGP